MRQTDNLNLGSLDPGSLARGGWAQVEIEPGMSGPEAETEEPQPGSCRNTMNL